MALDLSKINAGVTEFGQIVQQGVGIFDQIAGRVNGTPAPAPATTTAPPVVTTPAPAAVSTPAPATSSSPPWVLLGIVLLVIGVAAWKG